MSLPTAANVMPEGVCAALSFQSPYGTDPEFGPGLDMFGVPNPRATRPRSSDRGRIYVGPLVMGNPNFTADATTKRTKLSSLLATVLLAALKKLAHDALALTGSWALSQWSEKNSVVKAITSMWMDDRPDYQRRRADQSGIRYTGVIP
jgi:hypothetical protein